MKREAGTVKTTLPHSPVNACNWQVTLGVQQRVAMQVGSLAEGVLPKC